MRLPAVHARTYQTNYIQPKLQILTTSLKRNVFLNLEESYPLCVSQITEYQICIIHSRNTTVCLAMFVLFEAFIVRPIHVVLEAFIVRPIHVVLEAFIVRPIHVVFEAFIVRPIHVVFEAFYCKANSCCT